VDHQLSLNFSVFRSSSASLYRVALHPVPLVLLPLLPAGKTIFPISSVQRDASPKLDLLLRPDDSFLPAGIAPSLLRWTAHLVGQLAGLTFSTNFPLSKHLPLSISFSRPATITVLPCDPAFSGRIPSTLLVRSSRPARMLARTYFGPCACPIPQPSRPLDSLLQSVVSPWIRFTPIVHSRNPPHFTSLILEADGGGRQRLRVAQLSSCGVPALGSTCIRSLPFMVNMNCTQFGGGCPPCSPTGCVSTLLSMYASSTSAMGVHPHDMHRLPVTQTACFCLFYRNRSLRTARREGTAHSTLLQSEP
jgi:hypothetical protein